MTKYQMTVVAGDWADGLYRIRVGLAVSVTERIQVSREILDTFLRRPPEPDLLKNDVSTLASAEYRF